MKDSNSKIITCNPTIHFPNFLLFPLLKNVYCIKNNPENIQTFYTKIA